MVYLVITLAFNPLSNLNQVGEVGVGKVGGIGVFDEVALCQLDYPLQHSMTDTW